MDFLWLILLVVLAAFGLILLKPLRQIIRLRRQPTLPIGTLPHSGQVEVVGRASGSTMLSPISDTPCVLWQVEVQEHRGGGKSGHWVTILKRTSSQPIEMADGTGRVWAVLSGAELVLNDDLPAAHGLFGNMTPQIEAAVERLGVPLRGRAWTSVKQIVQAFGVVVFVNIIGPLAYFVFRRKWHNDHKSLFFGRTLQGTDLSYCAYRPRRRRAPLRESEAL